MSHYRSVLLIIDSCICFGLNGTAMLWNFLGKPLTIRLPTISAVHRTHVSESYPSKGKLGKHFFSVAAWVLCSYRYLEHQLHYVEQYCVFITLRCYLSHLHSSRLSVFAKMRAFRVLWLNFLLSKLNHGCNIFDKASQAVVWLPERCFVVQQSGRTNLLIRRELGPNMTLYHVKS